MVNLESAQANNPNLWSINFNICRIYAGMQHLKIRLTDPFYMQGKAHRSTKETTADKKIHQFVMAVSKIWSLYYLEEDRDEKKWKKERKKSTKETDGNLKKIPRSVLV